MAFSNSTALQFPEWPQWASAGYSSTPITTAGDFVAMVTEAPKAGTIESIVISLSTPTDPQSLRVSLQTVDKSTGLPTGTLISAGAEGTLATPSNAWHTISLGTPPTVTRGQLFAIVAEFTSTVGNVTFNRYGNVNSTMPYVVIKTAGGATSVSHSISWPWVIKYTGPSYGKQQNAPLDAAINNQTINNGTTPDEVALRFEAPFSFKFDNVVFHADLDGDGVVVVYDNADNILATGIVFAAAGGTTSNAYGTCTLHSEVTTTKDSLYRVSVKPTTGSSIGLRYVPVANNEYLSVISGGSGCYWSERTNDGAWTDNILRRPLLSLGVNEIDINSGAGGGGAGFLINGGLIR